MICFKIFNNNRRVSSRSISSSSSNLDITLNLCLPSRDTKFVCTRRRYYHNRSSSSSSSSLLSNSIITSNNNKTSITMHGQVPSLKLGGNRILLSSMSLSSSSSSLSSSSPFLSSLRLLTKPFLLKCHPDVFQDGNNDAKSVNLKAIQNLNYFLDSVKVIRKKRSWTVQQQQQQQQQKTFQIDFCLTLGLLEDESKNPEISQRKRKQQLTKKKETQTRRMVELLLIPPKGNEQQQQNDDQLYDTEIFENHITNELIKLIRVAGLEIPANFKDVYNNINHDDDDESLQQQQKQRSNDNNYYEDQFDNNNSTNNIFTNAWKQQQTYDDNIDNNNTSGGIRFQNDHKYHDIRKRKQHFENSRNKFTSKINWKKFDVVYKQAVHEMEVDLATEGYIRNNSTLRNKTIANILSNIQIKKKEHDDDDNNHHNLTIVEQWIAYRRISLLLDEHFDTLEIEKFGNLWGNITILFGPERDAKSIRKSKQGNSSGIEGYKFTLNSQNNVTITIPIDFEDDELVTQLENNVWHFYNILYMRSMDEFIPSY